MLVTTNSTQTALYTAAGVTETYKGRAYTLERREIATLTNARGYRVVWCWEVQEGPAAGINGGKCATKAEARTWARYTVTHEAEWA